MVGGRGNIGMTLPVPQPNFVSPSEYFTPCQAREDTRGSKEPSARSQFAHGL